MVFSSTVFLFLFLPLVLLGSLLLPRLGMRNAWLLVASLFFYAWGEQAYVLVMLASILLNYGLGLLVHHCRDRRQSARWVLALAVALNLGMLGAFKYANFLADNLSALLQLCGRQPLQLRPVHLPIGISFFTFQALSYVVDLYRGDARVQRNPLNFGLYVSLFPQLIAGPIVRYKDVDEQIDRRTTSIALGAAGVRRFVIGLAKKMILANTFAAVADRVFDLPPEQLTTGLAWTGALAYALQIYFDFSGYSDMAIGLGWCFGFHFLENFNFPYVATSIRDFWRRWHISLSTWFRDYLYVPLGGNRGSPARTGFNLVLVFFLCGLWHGASWVFVIWGLYHGLFLLLERSSWGALVARLPRPLQHAYVVAAVLVGWVFFRAATLPQALAFLAAMAGRAHGDGIALHAGMLWSGEFAATFALGLVAATPLWPAIAARVQRRLEQDRRARRAWLAELGQTAIDLVVLPLMFVFCAMLLARGTYNPFIYFRF
ncbi:MAG: MBOAT family protein [Lentisphaerae bacterium]|nr:MBOAT family protein [Lentisphaerota bacterium]